MNRVEDAVLGHRNPEEIGPLLDDLARFCSEHFATEERVLRRYGYANTRIRLARRMRLLARIPAVQQQLRPDQERDIAVHRLLHSLKRQAGYVRRVIHPGNKYHDSNGPLLPSY